MPRWTDEQMDAINKEGTNIIVSAGAGSGKTAVLSERVLRKLRDGTKISEMLILTFTNAAAFEMKERIRKKIKNDSSLVEQLDLIDASYVTTFDSFSLSMVKKYYYLLDVDKNLTVADKNIIDNKKREYLDIIFDKYYENPTEDFLKLISDFCVKDDVEIKDAILNLSSKMDLLPEKEEYLDKYIDTYYNDNYINSRIKEYLDKVNSKFNHLLNDLQELLSLAENKFYEDLEIVINKYSKAKTLEEKIIALKEKIPNLPRNSSEELKTLKESITNQKTDLIKYISFNNEEEIKETILSTKSYAIVFIDIIKKLDQMIWDYKKHNNTFEFIDIAKLAIKVVKDNPNIRDNLKNGFKEIMIDEYQDTSDLQEIFINLIENNNVYMVGDIKQAIYRFRNANPNIFKNKYDKYSVLDNGYKIDLLKNFRSRSEVLNNINLIFNPVMDNNIGGAEYKESHQMIFGNTSYNEAGKTNEDYNMDILNYIYDKECGFTKEEIEIFTIARDIESKVKNKYPIFDKDTGLIHDAKYSDFCILIHRTKDFDLYKKIFEYLNIPIEKYTSTDITQDNEINIIKNIITLIISVIKEKIDIEFKYAFISILRSYLYRLDDEEIFEYFVKDNYKESELYRKIENLCADIEVLSISKIIELIIDSFNIYEKSITVGDTYKLDIRLEYILKLSKQYEVLGCTLEEFRDFLDNLNGDNMSLECNFNDSREDSVKIMSIHKSKGLEFNICYFSGFYGKFNMKDLNSRFIFSNKYGMILPYYKDGIGTTIYKTLYKDDFLIDEISEKIRLFYVALTRAKEKMILVTSIEENESFNELVPDEVRIKYSSFNSILKSIYYTVSPYIKDIDIDRLNVSRDYNLIKKVNYKDQIDKSNEKINNIEINIDNHFITNKHFSKGSHEVLDEETFSKMQFGTYIHYLFELFDFKNPDYSYIEKEYVNYIKYFVESRIDFNTCDIYKEYEFIYKKDNIELHGIIDLLLVYKDKVMIIDYKLKNIDDDNYLKQLNGYKEYIEHKLGKETHIYLYSVLDKKLEELKG